MVTEDFCITTVGARGQSMMETGFGEQEFTMLRHRVFRLTCIKISIGFWEVVVVLLVSFGQ
jgi:hypothetical protein